MRKLRTVFLARVEFTGVDEVWWRQGDLPKVDTKYEPAKQAYRQDCVVAVMLHREAVKRLVLRSLQPFNLNCLRGSASNRSSQGGELRRIFKYKVAGMAGEKLICDLGEHSGGQEWAFKYKVDFVDVPTDSLHVHTEIYESVVWGFVELSQSPLNLLLVNPSFGQDSSKVHSGIRSGLNNRSVALRCCADLKATPLEAS